MTSEASVSGAVEGSDLQLRAMKGSQRLSHQSVLRAGVQVGELWREEALVVVSKLTEPRRMAKKWRWFGKVNGATETIGRGTRMAMLIGPGLKSRSEVLRAITAALAS